MSTQSKHNKPSPFDWAMTGLFIVSLFLLLILSGCSPRIYERVVYQKDTTYVSKIDSIYKYERDSVFVREKGDTVYKYVERVRYRDRYKVDTLIKVMVDSVAVERIKEVKVEKPLSWWQRAKIGAFWWMVAILLIGVVWIFRKPILRFMKILV